MSKYSYYVIEQQNTTTGKYYSYATKIQNCTNLICAFKPSIGFTIVSVNACDTFKEAKEIAEYWNQGAKENGKYCFDGSPLF